MALIHHSSKIHSHFSISRISRIISWLLEGRREGISDVFLRYSFVIHSFDFQFIFIDSFAFSRASKDGRARTARGEERAEKQKRRKKVEIVHC